MKQLEYTQRRSTRMTITHADAGSAIAIANFPVGTQVQVNFTTIEAFDNANTLKVGTANDDTKFYTAKSVATKTSETSHNLFVTTPSESEIVATVSGTATEGAVTITIDYTLPTSEEVSY